MKPRGSSWLVIYLFLGQLSLGVAQSLPLLQRHPNTTLQLPSAPPPPPAYTTERAFGLLTFTDPVAIVTPPGETNRVFVVEQRGRIAVITNLANPTRTVFLDISSRVLFGGEQGLLGLAFHPGYATNRFFYVYYTLNTTTAAGSGRHDRLSRFEVSPSNPSLALPTSEVPLITQRDEAENHNGADLHFGPDGYLYVSLGDEGGGDDNFGNSQKIDRDFFAGILRIDVDKRPGSLPPNPHLAATTNYAVPPDNPFIGTTNFNRRTVDPAKVRTEFYAVGLRNPWRMAFDRVTGFLYCADVGQNAREEIDIIVKGGNYGWNFREGNIARPGSGSPPAGVTFINPIQDYGHGTRTNQGNSVTGGFVYRGERLPQLKEAYIFGDYVSGHIWALWYQVTNTIPFRRLATDTGIAAFGEDPRNGDVLMADQDQDTIKRLVIQTNVPGPRFPPTLADTGAFADLAALIPHLGIIPYEINVPFWSDHAKKKRWFSLPNTNLTIGFNPDANWSFPTSAIWIKHFELELTNGVPESARRLETRFIVRYAGGVYGVTYRWGDSLTNAVLVPEQGLDEPFVIYETTGVARTQIWHYPSRSECLSCHTPVSGGVLGFNTAQLNRTFDYGNGFIENQLRALSQAGYFASSIGPIHTLRILAHPTNSLFSREYRVRSYLSVNCSQCHQPGGPALGFFDARITTPTALAGLIDGNLNDNGGNSENRVIMPGELDRSMLLARIATLGQGRMPPIATSVLDTQAIDLISSWITNDLVNFQSFTDWQLRHFGSTDDPKAAAGADPDSDGASNQLEFLVATDPLSSADLWKIGIRRSGQAVQILFPQNANRGFEVQQTSDLFNPLSWEPLDVPSNRPFFFSSTNFNALVEEPLPIAPAIFYRVRVSEP